MVLETTSWEGGQGFLESALLMHNFSSRTLWKTSLSQLPAPAVPPDETKPWIHWVFRRQHSRTPMSDAECGRKLYTDVLAHFRHLVAGISQADPFERKAPEPAGGLSFDPCRFESDSESPLGIQKLNVGFSNWTSDSETTDVIFRNYSGVWRIQNLLRFRIWNGILT